MRFKKGDFVTCKEGVDRGCLTTKPGIVCQVVEIKDNSNAIDVVIKEGKMLGETYTVHYGDLEYCVPKLHAGIEPGYICVLRDGTICMVYTMSTSDGEEIVLSNGQCRFVGYDKNLSSSLYPSGDIMEIYGYSSEAGWADELSLCYRSIIWKRQEPKKMTVKEIADALGFEVEIIEG